MRSDIRVRFAPSPTGHLHIGTARTALFNWLFARHFDGTFILRIEDTDRDRSTVEYERTIIEDLAWLGLAWDEGPDIGGPYGPYRQTERMAGGAYLTAAEKLLKQGDAYQCFCTPEELAAERELALARGEMPKYSGRCRGLSDERKRAFVEAGREPGVRFAVPESRRIVFDDLIRGRMEFSTEVIGDFIILRQNQAPTYNFAAVLDDAEMRITHVLRGEDHLTNTARQILVFEALDREPPSYGHFSMILGPDKTKLSKRHGAAAIGEYRREGYVPEALLNYLALLSWSSPTGEEVFDIEEITKEFSLERVSRGPAVFDLAKLRWLNGRHIRRFDPTTLANLLLPYLTDEFEIDPAHDPAQFAWTMRISEAIQTNLEVLSEAPAYAKIFFTVEYDEEARRRLVQGGATERVLTVFSDRLEGREYLEKEAAKELVAEAGAELKEAGIKPKEVFQTLRLALTGQTSGPELFYLLYALGPKEAVRRLKQDYRDSGL